MLTGSEGFAAPRLIQHLNCRSLTYMDTDLRFTREVTEQDPVLCLLEQIGSIN